MSAFIIFKISKSKALEYWICNKRYEQKHLLLNKNIIYLSITPFSKALIPMQSSIHEYDFHKVLFNKKYWIFYAPNIVSLWMNRWKPWVLLNAVRKIIKIIFNWECNTPNKRINGVFFYIFSNKFINYWLNYVNCHLNI